MKKDFFVLRLVCTLFLITAVVAGALAGINAITEDKIAAAQEEKVQKAIAAVLPGGNAQEMDYQAPEGSIVEKIYVSDSGFAVQVAPAGFGGTISMMVGFSTWGQVQGISIISHSETAGLGAVAAADNAAGQAFREQFEGLYGMTIALTKDGGQVDALTSATITSRAVVTGVNAAREAIQSYLLQEVSP